MATSRESLLEFLNSLVHCNLAPDSVLGNGGPPFSGQQMLALLCYMIKVDLMQTQDTLSNFLDVAPDFAIKDSSSDEFGLSLGPASLAYDMATEFFEAVASFMPEFQKFFSVPKVERVSGNTLERNEMLAAFVDFLVQILDCKCGDRVDLVEDRILALKKEMRFLIFFLGDVPLRSAEVEEVKEILDEYEVLANMLGRLVYSFYFSRYGVGRGEKDEALDAIFGKIDFFKAHIQKYCIKLLNVEPSATVHSAAVDSLFIVDSLLDDLEGLINGKDESVLNVMDQIVTLYASLMSLRSLVEYMEVPFNTEIKEFRLPMLNIRDSAYEAEHLVNSFVVGNVPVWYLTLRLDKIIEKIRSIHTALEEMKRNKEIGVDPCAHHVDKIVSPQATTYPRNDTVVGLEDEETEIMKQLCSHESKNVAITIFGMPGLGKTTLAKRVFDYLSSGNRFDKCVWAVVSSSYHKKELLISILGSLTQIDRNSVIKMEVDTLGIKIHKILKYRRYLLVLDDVWNIAVWDDLKRYFPDDGNGSRILFTSRNKDVVPSNTVSTIPLLSKDQCWELIKTKVWGVGFSDEACPRELLGVGKQIAANCGGLPLAAVIVAGILANVKKEESAWKEVESSTSSYVLSDQESNCSSILELSYKHLPGYLKPCFLYFAAFPEDTEVSAKRLIPLWIAEGFIRKDENKSLQTIGEKYLSELIDRSLVLIAKHRSTGGVKSCSIHDLLRELCLKKAKEENFHKLIQKDYSIYERHHRLSVYADRTGSYTSRQFFRRCLRPFGLHIRSIIGELEYASFYFPSTKLLRTLDLLAMPQDITGDCDEIGLLVHLKYLAMKGDIPASVGSLAKLEFFLVKSSNGDIIVIPASLLKLGKLRHLQATQKARFGKDCNGFLPSNLQTLSFVQILELSDLRILQCLPDLRKLKCECGVLFPDLSFLVQLDTLKMVFNSILTDCEKINFPMNVKMLTLSGMGLPWKDITVIGKLSYLEVLKLENDAFVGKTWETSDDEFQNLKYLKLNDMKFEEWVTSSEHFPKLQRLIFLSCYYIMDIPSEVGDILTLESIQVRWCNTSLKESVLQIQEQQNDMGNDELKVLTSNTFSEQSELIPALKENFVNQLISELMPDAGMEDRQDAFEEVLRAFESNNPTGDEDFNLEAMMAFSKLGI